VGSFFRDGRHLGEGSAMDRDVWRRGVEAFYGCWKGGMPVGWGGQVGGWWRGRVFIWVDDEVCSDGTLSTEGELREWSNGTRSGGGWWHMRYPYLGFLLSVLSRWHGRWAIDEHVRYVFCGCGIYHVVGSIMLRRDLLFVVLGMWWDCSRYQFFHAGGFSRV